MDAATARRLAEEWIAAWNARDLDRICRHYAEDVELRSPAAVVRLNRADGQVKGMADLRSYFAQGLAAAPNLRFELVDVPLGMNGYAIVYRRETGLLVADVIGVDAQGRARDVRAFYGTPLVQ